MDVTVLILTLNEEINLPYALESVKNWANQIIVVDSFSTDKTVEIAKSFGAEVYQNKFVDFTTQRNWALTVPAYKNDWVFYLDADEQVTPELKEEINRVLPTVSDSIGGFTMRRCFFFLGKWLRHGGYYIWLLRLFRRDRARFVYSHQGGEYPVVKGDVLKLQNDILHIDRRPLSDWIQNQNKDSTKVALALFKAKKKSINIEVSKEEEIEGSFRFRLNKYVYSKVPLFLRPFFRFLFFYFGRRAFLDGWQGFAYCVLHEFWYPLLVNFKLKELQASELARIKAEQSYVPMH